MAGAVVNIPELTDDERDKLHAAILSTMYSWKGEPQERRHIADTLGFVSARTHELKANSEILILQAQVEVLTKEVEALRRRSGFRSVKQ